MHYRLPALALASLALSLAACTKKGDCQEDFDCTVGQVCQGATTSDPGTCTAAAPGATRTFGKVSLDFSGGDETYLLSVVSIPAGAEAITTSETSFSLASGGGTGTAALRALLLAPSAQPLAPADARFAFDAARHARIAEIAQDYSQSGAYRGQIAALQAAALTTAACGDCGSNAMCWQGQCTADVTVNFINASTPVTGQLAGVVDTGPTPINVVVDTANASAATAAVGVVQDFAKTFATELGILGLTNGHSGPLDRDGDGRLTVVFTNKTVGTVDTGIVGLFDPDDFVPASDSKATGNEADILWARIPNSSNSTGAITPELLTGTLAHEYTHLASYAVRVQARLPQARQEVYWLDEGLAHSMEDLTGWGGSNIGMVALALSGWNDGTLALNFASLTETREREERGKACLFVRHFIDRSGSTALVADLLNEEATGLEHSAFVQGGPDAWWQWQLATYATGNTDIPQAQSGAHAYDYSPLTTSSLTGNKVGIDPHGSYVDARNATVDLTGPETGLVDSANSLSGLADSTIMSSGTLLYEVSGGTGIVELRGTATADADLHVAATRVK